MTLADMPIEAVAPIFERINSTGTQLTIVDLMRAATWSPEFDLIDTIDQKILEQIQPKGFSGIERKSVLRSLSAAAGGGFSADSIDNLRNKTALELQEATTQTVDAYRRAVDYLSTNIGLPNDNAMPYANQIVILAEIYRRLPNPDLIQQKAITEWFWQSACSSYFGGWNTGQMGQDLEAVSDFTDGKSKIINLSMIRPTAEVWRVKQFRANSALSKVLGMVLSFNTPKDLRTGNKIDFGKSPSWSNAKEYHHIFPRSYLVDRNYSWNKINCLANFALITFATNKFISDKEPKHYIEELISQGGPEYGAVLHSNFINTECVTAMRHNDFESFIHIRSELLHERILSYCGWSAPTTPAAPPPPAPAPAA